jgi:hypothetical protein
MEQKWLQRGWEKDIHHHVLWTKQNSNMFWECAVQMRGLNALFCDTSSHLSNDKSCNQLEANIDKCLITSCNDEKVNDVVNLKIWLSKVKSIDKKLHCEREQAKKDAEDAACTAAAKHSMSMAGILHSNLGYFNVGI